MARLAVGSRSRGHGLHTFAQLTALARVLIKLPLPLCPMPAIATRPRRGLSFPVKSLFTFQYRSAAYYGHSLPTPEA